MPQTEGQVGLPSDAPRGILGHSSLISVEAGLPSATPLRPLVDSFLARELVENANESDARYSEDGIVSLSSGTGPL